MNRLHDEKSAYLRQAAHQKVDWYPWCEDAFERARREDKPVFLSSGAIWCHWCHVMAKESFNDDEVASILNEHFICIKLDRDERPDIDRRYQRALAGMGLSGGWPLSIFLTPDKKPFYGGTYFPPDEAYGRPSFKIILVSIRDLYKKDRREVETHSQQLVDMLNNISPGTGSPITEDMLLKGTQSVMSGADTAYGGFGTAPKFAMSGAIEFLLGRFCLTGDNNIGLFLQNTLNAMANGGIHDHLGGGFHRYSTDRQWIIPHFEKMADDNAWLLRNYANAYRLFGEDRYRKVAGGIIDFVLRELSHPDGGFYTSQDADVTPDDEGGYFTWTEDQFGEVLQGEELRTLSGLYLHQKGGMHHDFSKKVLHTPIPAGRFAQSLGQDPGQIEKVITAGKMKLLNKREQRVKPFVDRAIYTSINGMMISAFLKASRLLSDERSKDFALKSIDTVLENNYRSNTLYHGEGVRALFDDYVFLIDALTYAYEATGRARYLELAGLLMEEAIERFGDKVQGGFFDTDDALMGMELKGIEDTPHPSANAVAVIALLRLSFMKENEKYRRSAEDTLKAFSSTSVVMGLHSGYYFVALDAWYNMAELTVNALPGTVTARDALAFPYPYSVLRYSKETAAGTIIPCMRTVCHEPVRDITGLQQIVPGYTR